MTTLTLTAHAVHDLEVEAVVLATVPTDGGAALAEGHGLPSAAVKHVGAALSALGATAALEEVLTLTAVPKVAAGKVVLTGLGAGATPAAATSAAGGGVAVDHDALRRAAGAALRGLEGAASVAVALPHEDASGLAAVAEGAHAGTYTFTAHKSSAQPGAPTDAGSPPRRGRRRAAADTGPELTLVSSSVDGSDGKRVVARATALGAATAYARDLVNTPPNILYPQSFAESVVERAKVGAGKVDVEVLDDAALAEGGFGGIVGVGQGSTRPPRIVVMTYTPRARKAPSVALVGKGITFDTGGVCIKPAGSMLTMKSDMAGAAAVAGTVLAAAELGLPVKVTGYLCLAENMPGGNAQRPGDVVTMRGGRTVEIIDTDAEGRMVLADGMSLACESAPDALVDIATLTGACTVALGNRVAGVMGHDDAFRGRVTSAAQAAGEAAWPLPLPGDLRPTLDSQVADISHKGERWGGALTAGLFLGEFVGTTPAGDPIPWAHVDIAGPSFNEGKAWGHTPKGGTGYGVATLLRLVEDLAP